MREVLTELMVPLLAAVLVGLAMGWMIWRRGRLFLSRSDYEFLREKARRNEAEPRLATAQLVQQAGVLAEVQRDLRDARGQKAHAEQTVQRLGQELQLRNSRISELQSGSTGRDNEISRLQQHLAHAQKDIEHSATYIRALEAELAMTPASSR